MTRTVNNAEIDEAIKTLIQKRSIIYLIRLKLCSKTKWSLANRFIIGISKIIPPARAYIRKRDYPATQNLFNESGYLKTYQNTIKTSPPPIDHHLCIDEPLASPPNPPCLQHEPHYRTHIQAPNLINRLISLAFKRFYSKNESSRTIGTLLHNTKRGGQKSKIYLSRLLLAHQNYLTQSLATNPKCKQTRHNLAIVLYERARYQQAKSILDSLLLSTKDSKIVGLHIDCCCALTNLQALELIIGQSLSMEMTPRLVLAIAAGLQKLGRQQEAQELLKANVALDPLAISIEATKNSFILSDFKHAAQCAEEIISKFPNKKAAALLAIAAYLELKDTNEAVKHVAKLDGKFLYKRERIELCLLKYHLYTQLNQTAKALDSINHIYRSDGFQSIIVTDAGSTAYFDRLGSAPTKKPKRNPIKSLVSVIMTTHNAKAYVKTSVKSILAQSHDNLELIIVDDSSTDGTPEELLKIETTDPRIRVVLKTTNDGTYVSKNIGLLHASGEFIAFQDSDDWSHPDRISHAIALLHKHPEVIALTTDWIRITSEGEIIIKQSGQILHRCCISLVVRRSALAAIGFFDSVRIAADLELIERLEYTFGHHNVLRIKFPFIFGRSHQQSLTANLQYGISRRGFSPPRLAYHQFAAQYHSEIACGRSPYMPFPQSSRPFPAPKEILP